MRTWAHLRFAASVVAGAALALSGPGVAHANHFTTIITEPAEGAVMTTNPVHIQGTAGENTFVTIYENDEPFAGDTAGSSGAWSVDVPMNRGTHTIHACALDINEGDLICSADRTFTLDLPAPPPAAPVISAPAEGALILTSSASFSGTAQAGAVVRVWEGNTLKGSATANTGGSWSKSISFADGAHTVVAIAYDQYGQFSDPTAPRSFTVDAPPSPPSITSPTQSSYLPHADVTVAGASEPNGLIKVRESTAVLGTATADGSGAWSMVITFAPGQHKITATQTDPRGRESSKSSMRTLSVDLERPVVSISGDDPHVAATNLSLAGGATDDLGVASISVDYVRRHVAHTATDPADCSGCPGPSVTWVSDPSVPPGVYDATAVAVDRAGNESEAVTVTVVVGLA